MQSVGGERAAGFHQVDHGVGHTQGDHHFHRAGEIHDVRPRLVPGQECGGDLRKAGGHAFAVQVRGPFHGAVVRDAQRKPAVADA